jgi:hypothetical protein
MEKTAEDKTKIVVPKGKHAFTCSGTLLSHFISKIRKEPLLSFMISMNLLNKSDMVLMVSCVLLLIDNLAQKSQ